jgi:hypothetical protein
MTIADVNVFIDGDEHEAQMRGNIAFGQFAGQEPAEFAMEESNSRFHYLRVNPVTGEAEMRYHIQFSSPGGQRYTFEGVKYMQRAGVAGIASVAEVLQNYTALYCHVYEQTADGATQETGTAYLKFRTFENVAAVGDMAAFLGSLQATGTSDAVTQLQARLRFLAFTAQFVQREYDSLGFGNGQAAGAAGNS